MRKAFFKFEKNGKANVNDILVEVNAVHGDNEWEVLVVLLQRMVKLPRIKQNEMVTFDEFIDLLKQCCNVRETAEDVRMLFNLLVEDDKNVIL